MIAVPDAVLFPTSPRPAALASASVMSRGNPFGYVAIAWFVTTPAISQWPVIVSLPAEASRIAPYPPRGAATGGTPAIDVRCPIPSAPRLGSASPPTARAMWANVSAPASP
jgi:hypothetical protein